MASESPQLEQTSPQAGPDDQSANPFTDTAKRKAEQTNGTQTRTKRNRYISIAWYDYILIGPILFSRLLLFALVAFACRAESYHILSVGQKLAKTDRNLRLATNASAGRSSAMAKSPASDVDISS